MRHFVAVDFEEDSLRAQLKAAGFDEQVPTVTAWLGVVPYLTTEGFRATMRLLARFRRAARWCLTTRSRARCCRPSSS